MNHSRRETRLYSIRVFLFLLSLGGLLAAGFHELVLADGFAGTLVRVIETIGLVLIVLALAVAFMPWRTR